jgi:hypothetical protein
MALSDLASSGTPAPPQMAPVGPGNNDMGPGTSMAAPSLKDKVRNHVQQLIQNRPANGGFAGGRSANAFFEAEWHDEDNDGWTKYDSPDPARQGGPKKPPATTTVKGGDPKWHSREPEGKFKSTSPFKAK